MKNLDVSISHFLKSGVIEHVKEFDSGVEFNRSVIRAAANDGLLDFIFSNQNNSIQQLSSLAKIIEEVSGTCGNSRNFFLVSCAMFGKTLERYISSNNFFLDVYKKIAIGDAIGAVAHTEKSGGSDSKAFQTRITSLSNGNKVINGSKTWITFAGIADYFLVSSFLDGELVVVLIPRISEGVTIKLIESVNGNRGSAISEIEFKNVVIEQYQILPSSCLVTKWNTLEWIFSIGRVFAASSAIGLTKSAINMSFLRLKTRESFGKKLIENQTWQQELVELSSQLRAVESLRDVALTYLAAGRYDFLNADCSIVKILAAKLAIDAAQVNIRVHGAYGYLENEPPNRMLREALSFEFIEGMSQVLNRKIFSQLSGQFIVSKAAKG